MLHIGNDMLQRWKLTYKHALAAFGIVSLGLNIVAFTALGALAHAQKQAIKPKIKRPAATTLKAPPERVAPPLAGADSAESKEQVVDTEHPAEVLSDAESPSTVIEFLNVSSSPIAIFQLTEQGERQPSGDLAPAMKAGFSTRIGARWLVTDARHNALAIFLADAQPRTLEVNDAKIDVWKRQLAQDSIVVRGERGETLHTFCMGPDDNLYTLLTKSQGYGEVSPVGEFEGGQTGEVRVFSSRGNELRRFSLDFKPHRIAVAPDGEIIVGGMGVIARFTSDGKRVAKHLPPNLASTEGDWSTAAAQAREANIRECNEQIALLEEQANAQRSDAEMFAERIKPLKQKLAVLQQQSIDESVQDLKESLGCIYAVTASTDVLYVATRMPTGFGFAIWKMKRDATCGRQIIANLSGCCGLLDMQIHGDHLFVAENSRHRVLKFDGEGKRVAQFGRREREGYHSSFSGCCNPMNLCFAANGDLYTAETNGKVKCFTPQGEFVSTIASFQSSAGCANVAIAATKNRDRIFYLDLANSQIVTSRINANAKPSGD